MTMLPPPTRKKLGLVIDLDICVGCHACAVACKEWNDGGEFGPLPDENPYGAEPLGVWFNRVHSYEVEPTEKNIPAMTVHFPRSCLHCETPDCVTVCPTGASYKRAEDGIVLVDADQCIGCKLCSWACPYGAREYSEVRGVMQSARHVDRAALREIFIEARERGLAYCGEFDKPWVASAVARKQRESSAMFACGVRQFLGTVAPVLKAAEQADNDATRLFYDALDIEIDRHRMFEPCQIGETE